MKMSIEEMRAVIDKHSTIKHWAYIIHDKDVREDGSPKEPHIHLYLNFGKSGASFATVASWFKDGTERVNAVKGKRRGWSGWAEWPAAAPSISHPPS